MTGAAGVRALTRECSGIFGVDDCLQNSPPARCTTAIDRRIRRCERTGPAACSRQTAEATSRHSVGRKCKRATRHRRTSNGSPTQSARRLGPWAGVDAKELGSVHTDDAIAHDRRARRRPSSSPLRVRSPADHEPRPAASVGQKRLCSAHALRRVRIRSGTVHALCSALPRVKTRESAALAEEQLGRLVGVVDDRARPVPALRRAGGGISPDLPRDGAPRT